MIKTFLDYLYFTFEIFCYHIPFFAKLFIKIHSPSVKKEIEMSNLSSSDKILHIGCGAIPYTTIVISKETDAKIVGIDKESRIVNIATDFVRKYNISDIVKIEIGNGKTHNVSDFDVIILSYGIDRQDLVLKHVFNSVKKGSRILLRRSISKKEDYIDSIVKNYSVNRTRLLLTQESVLIVKKDQKKWIFKN